MYWACGKELQVLLPATVTLPEQWVDILMLVDCAQLLVNTHVTPWGIVDRTSCLVPSVVPIGGQVCTQM